MVVFPCEVSRRFCSSSSTICNMIQIHISEFGGRGGGWGYWNRIICYFATIYCASKDHSIWARTNRHIRGYVPNIAYPRQLSLKFRDITDLTLSCLMKMAIINYLAEKRYDKFVTYITNKIPCQFLQNNFCKYLYAFDIIVYIVICKGTALLCVGLGYIAVYSSRMSCAYFIIFLV